MAITSSELKVNGKRYRLLSFGDFSVRVYDDARTSLLIIALFNDPDADIATKYEIALQLLFVDPIKVAENIEDISGLFSKALKEVVGFKDKEDKEKQVLDWDADAQYIKASMQMTYGKPFDEIAKEVDYEELCHMVALCPHETPIGQALYYRTAKPPKATKYNLEEREEFRKKQKFWALETKGKTKGKPKRKVDPYEEMSKQATFAARAIKRARR